MCNSLNEAAEKTNMQLIRVPGHRDIVGNGKADNRAKIGTELLSKEIKMKLDVPPATCKPEEMEKGKNLLEN